MNWLKIVLVVLVFVANLAIAQPSWADYNYAQNPEYTNLVQMLDAAVQLQEQEGVTPESVQAIDELKFQKYVMETGGKYGVCRNETGADLFVYGAKSKKSSSTYDKELYSLATGYETDDEWDCAGIYSPATTEGETATPATALKIVPGTFLVATKNPATANTELNVTPAAVLKAGDVNWQIPETLEGLTGIRKAPAED